MPTKQQKIIIPEGENNRFKDEQTDKRIHEHLTNEKDVISEADIRNIKTNLDGENGSDMVDDKLIGDDLEERKIRDDSDPEIDTPWNILGK